MPSSLVNRYSVYVSIPGKGKVRRPISRDPSLFLAVERCIDAYETTGHGAYVVEDNRPVRAFTLERKLLLAFVFLRANDRARYFAVLNQLDRSGDQDVMESSLADYIPI
jgi:hypothetical protein